MALGFALDRLRSQSGSTGAAVADTSWQMATHEPHRHGERESELLATLEAAMSMENTALIVRTGAAIVELKGPLALRHGAPWFTLGPDDGSHLHLRLEDIAELRFSTKQDANAALELLDKQGASICKISFRGTNRARPDRFDACLTERIQDRFAHLTPHIARLA